jgi:hypothetical protein
VVRVDPRSEIIASQPARTFLIDLSRVGRSLSQLRLQWQPGNDDFMATLAGSPASSHDAVGLGTDLRFSGRVSGGALEVDERIVHLFAFPMNQQADGNGGPQSRFVRASRRRRGR